MSARSHFVKELTLAAAHVAQTNKNMATQRRRIARIKCAGGNTGQAEDLLEAMLDVHARHEVFTINFSTRYSLRRRARQWPTSTTLADF